MLDSMSFTCSIFHNFTFHMLRNAITSPRFIYVNVHSSHKQIWLSMLYLSSNVRGMDILADVKVIQI